MKGTNDQSGLFMKPRIDRLVQIYWLIKYLHCELNDHKTYSMASNI